MDAMKVRLKVGVHEFEAEGPPNEVNAQLAIWQGLISSQSAADGRVTKDGTTRDSGGDGSGEPRSGPGTGRLFVVDDRKDLVTLRAHPQGEDRAADAVLLIVYGYRALRNLEDVPVTKLLESLRVSGISVERIDRAVAPHLTAGYLLKAGRAKGGRYRLTNTGMAAATRLAEELTSTMA